MARIPEAEVDERLRSGGDCRLGCLDEAGSPYVVPVGYHWVHGEVHLIARDRAAWAAYLLRDPRISLCIDGREPGVGNWRFQIQGRATVVAGPVSGHDLPSIADHRAEAERDGWLNYFNAVSGEHYYDFAIQPEKVTTWKGNDWAQRYKRGDWHA
jgi:nitroimidazol reductase NimA-like FMN-containing flavoprotein (pyridoxamine 5'-phosphate oxidase superfamily)